MQALLYIVHGRKKHRNGDLAVICPWPRNHQKRASLRLASARSLKLEKDRCRPDQFDASSSSGMRPCTTHASASNAPRTMPTALAPLPCGAHHDSRATPPALSLTITPSNAIPDCAQHSIVSRNAANSLNHCCSLCMPSLPCPLPSKFYSLRLSLRPVYMQATSAHSCRLKTTRSSPLAAAMEVVEAAVREGTLQ